MEPAPVRAERTANVATINASQQALNRALRAAVQRGAVDQAGADALLAKAERGDAAAPAG